MRTPFFPLENDEYFLVNFERTAKEIVELVRAKRKDYGSSMGFHGTRGLMPRIADKFFRLDNLVWNAETPKYESAEDTARDMAVYCLAMAVALEYERTYDDEGHRVR